MEILKEIALDEMKDYATHVIAWWPELEEGVLDALLSMVMNMDAGVEKNQAIDKCLDNINELVQR